MSSYTSKTSMASISKNHNVIDILFGFILKSDLPTFPVPYASLLRRSIKIVCRIIIHLITRLAALGVLAHRLQRRTACNAEPPAKSTVTTMVSYPLVSVTRVSGTRLFLTWVSVTRVSVTCISVNRSSVTLVYVTCVSVTWYPGIWYLCVCYPGVWYPCI